jgi:uncharacterized protein YdaU (DUF1376 family)
MEIVVHYYHHHIGDFIKATARLTDAQSMAYLRLIWMYYDRERPLPDDIEALAFQLGIDEKTVQLILVSYFRLEDGCWHHTRCDAEIKEYKQLIHKRSKAGKASAEHRTNTSSTPVEQVFNTQPTDVQLTNNQEPVTSNHIEKNTPRQRVERPDDVTETVWEAFLQLRKGKRAAVSDVALKAIRKEASKAGLSLDAAMQEMCARGWTGFKSEWFQKNVSKSDVVSVMTGRKESLDPRIQEHIDAIIPSLSIR